MWPTEYDPTKCDNAEVIFVSYMSNFILNLAMNKAVMAEPMVIVWLVLLIAIVVIVVFREIVSESEYDSSLPSSDVLMFYFTSIYAAFPVFIDRITLAMPPILVYLLIHNVCIVIREALVKMKKQRGLNELYMKELVVATYNETEAAVVSALGDISTCEICLEHFNVGDLIVQLPCKHIFCKSCIFKWLKANVTCPCCRYDVQRHFTS